MRAHSTGKAVQLQSANAVLAVLVECESIAKEFGTRYGNEFANTLQSIANKRVSGQSQSASNRTPRAVDADEVKGELK